ncbi:APC family permease [Microbacterium sp. 22303]|uniref:APC family permease n=1 Tax=Microbacterium sp. 22303 TaxID=3453905 RepID=UPI003F8790D5
MAEPATVTAALTVDDRRLQRKLGYWSLVAMGIGSVIGSGWLFAAMFAAQAAGPASLIAWVVGGAIMLALAWVTAELGITHPESGGTSRYPLYSNGRFAAGVIGWCGVVAVIGTPSLEAAAVMQYASSYIPGIFAGGSLTPLGVFCAAALLAGFTLLNYFGVKLFSESNNLVTAIKVLIPTTAIIALFISGFAGAGGAGGVGNFSAGGGFAPYGASAALAIIATGGILFSFNGAAVIITISGEVKNPRRNIPRAMVTTIVFSIALYIGLQLAFIVATPKSDIAGGWHGINFNSPFAELALALGLQWLYWILIADAGLSPTGAAMVGVGSNARNVFALAKNGFLPRWLQKIDDKWGVPRRALAVNFLVGLAFLLPLPSWHAIVSIIGILGALTFGVASVSAGVFRRAGVTTSATRLRGVGILAPITFAAGGLVVTWVPWATILPTIPLLGIGFLWYFVTFFAQKHSRQDLRGGLWLIIFYVFLYVACFLGGFGIHIIAAPWDSIIVAGGSIAFYYWGVHEGTRYMRANPQIAESMREVSSEIATEEREAQAEAAR